MNVSIVLSILNCSVTNCPNIPKSTQQLGKTKSPAIPADVCRLFRPALRMSEGDLPRAWSIDPRERIKALSELAAGSVAINHGIPIKRYYR